MDPKLEKILSLNEDLSGKVKHSLPKIIESLQKTKFQNTGKALISFVARSGALNNSILNSCVNKDIYTIWVIFRSIIEHNFKHLYIYTRALNEDSDSIGSDYRNLKANEDLEAFSKINNYNKVVNPTKTNWSTKGDHNKSNELPRPEGTRYHLFVYSIVNRLRWLLL